MGEWDNRFPGIEVVAFEELNALIARTRPPGAPPVDPRLIKNLDVDVRIVMSWDADATDVDLHVVEPSGEEAAYNHNRTTIGGLVSHDLTQGYGPEEYMVRRGMPGPFKIFARYYGSRQTNPRRPVHDHRNRVHRFRPADAEETGAHAPPRPATTRGRHRRGSGSAVPASRPTRKRSARVTPPRRRSPGRRSAPSGSTSVPKT